MNKEELKKSLENNKKLEDLKNFINKEYNSGLNEFNKTDAKWQIKLAYLHGRLNVLGDIKNFLEN